MKETKLIMGMPISIEINSLDVERIKQVNEKIFQYFVHIDKKFSTYKNESEISALNRGEILEDNLSEEMKEVLKKSEETKRLTKGYFDIFYKGKCDPSGLVKGWSIYNASKLLRDLDCINFYIDAGGDVQTNGFNPNGKKWSIGIKNPFRQQEIVKVVYLSGEGLATSGNYIRGEHIYNPHGKKQQEIVSMSVIAENVYEADRYATGAFAMGRKGIEFIERAPGFEGYIIDREGMATSTSGWGKYEIT